MLKLFGYGDKLREGFFTRPEDIELLSNNDYRTAHDINRPLKNIYEGVEKLYDYLNVFSDWKLTDDGVFPNSLKHEFSIIANNVIKVRLYDKRPVIPTYVEKVYTKLSPGIAGVSHSEDRQNSMVVVHRPNINLLERQLEYILGLFYYDGSESVTIKWNQDSDTFKALIKAKPHPEDPINSYEFGGSFDDEGSIGISSIQLLADIYNSNDLNARFAGTVGPDLTRFLLEPIYEITSTGTHFWEIVDGEVSLNKTGNEGFRIGQFDVTDLTTPSVENVQQQHRRYGKNVRLNIFGTDDNSYDVHTNGGVVYDIGKGLHIENSAGALVEITQEGDITINSAPGRNMSFGGVNILGIQANTINLTSVLNQDGTTDIDATGEGESFTSSAETHNQNADTQNNNIGEKNDTIITEVRNISGTQEETVVGKQTVNSNEEYELNTPVLDENITTEKTLNTPLETNTVTERVEEIGNETQHLTGTKKVTADTEIELNTPLLDKNITQEDETIETQNTNVTNKNETVGTEIRNVTTHEETIGTETRTVTGSKTENVNGDNTETVGGTNTVNADAQRINADVDVIISAPSITLNAGETGVVHIIGEQQTIEGETVRLEDNVIELNKNQTGTPSAGLVSGVEVNRGTSANAQTLFRESDDTWVNGVVGNLKAIANREDNNAIIANGIPSWDSVSKIFKTDNKFTHNRSTGSLTVNTDNATTTPPFITNSSAKVNNLNVDKVDGVDVDNSGAAAGEIVSWLGGTSIGTSNKSFVTAIATDGASTDSQVPTAEAVSEFAVKTGTLAVVAYSKGFRISYQNGEGAIGVRTIELANMDVDKVDGVDINKTGAAAGEIAYWSSASTLATSNKTFGTAFSATPGDVVIPTEKAVKNYIDSRSFTITLAGDATGTVTMSPTGSQTLTVAVVNDSHTHDGRYYTETESNARYLRKDLANGLGNAQTMGGSLTIGEDLNVNGDVTAVNVFGSVWNDLAELFPKGGETEPGDVVMMSESGVVKCNKRNSKLVVGIHSDTYGFLLGRETKEKIKEDNKTPIGLSGRVWVKMNTPCKMGDLLISGKDGFAIVKKWYHFGQGNILGKVMESKTDKEVSRVEMKIM